MKKIVAGIKQAMPGFEAPIACTTYCNLPPMEWTERARRRHCHSGWHAWRWLGHFVFGLHPNPILAVVEIESPLDVSADVDMAESRKYCGSRMRIVAVLTKTPRQAHELYDYLHDPLARGITIYPSGRVKGWNRGRVMRWKGERWE